MALAETSAPEILRNPVEGDRVLLGVGGRSCSPSPDEGVSIAGAEEGVGKHIIVSPLEIPSLQSRQNGAHKATTKHANSISRAESRGSLAPPLGGVPWTGTPQAPPKLRLCNDTELD